MRGLRLLMSGAAVISLTKQLRVISSFRYEAADLPVVEFHLWMSLVDVFSDLLEQLLVIGCF